MKKKELRIGRESDPCCCCLRLQGELNFQIRLICWKWDWPVAILWQVGKHAGHFSTKSHVLFHVILEPMASERVTLAEVITMPLVLQGLSQLSLCMYTHIHPCSEATVRAHLHSKHISVFVCLSTYML